MTSFIVSKCPIGAINGDLAARRKISWAIVQAVLLAEVVHYLIIAIFMLVARLVTVIAHSRVELAVLRLINAALLVRNEQLIGESHSRKA